MPAADRPVDRLVSIEEMGQAVMSVLVQRPDVARSKPSQVFNEGTYELVFGGAHDVAMYYSCIRILREATDYLIVSSDLTAAEDLRFHLAMVLAMALTGKPEPRATDIIKLQERDFSTATARDLEKLIRAEFKAANSNKRTLMLDQLAKDEKVCERVRQAGHTYLNGGQPPRKAARRRTTLTEPGLSSAANTSPS